jgi:carboxyl-terminal processing protease
MYVGKNRQLSAAFEVDEEVLLEFRTYLAGRKIPFTESEITENLVWIKFKIEQEVLAWSMGAEQGMKILIENDPQVLSAVDHLAQAAALYAQARKIVAQRSGALTIERR